MAHELNGTAAFIWEQLAQENTVEELQNKICDAYKIESATARADLIQCLNAFTEKGLAEWIG